MQILGVNNIFFTWFIISGLREIWFSPDELYGGKQISIYFRRKLQRFFFYSEAPESYETSPDFRAAWREEK